MLRGAAWCEVEKMGSVTFDLIEQQPHENRGGSFSCVLLQKDRKNICRTKICDLPIEVPFVWPLISFIPTKAYQKSVLPKFSLLPYPEDGRQKHEWGKFMRFLWDNKKTGAMKLGKDAIVLTQTSSSRSVAFLSQSFNEGKDNLEIPVVAYRKEGQYMEVDLSVQSEATAEYNLSVIKEFSSFNEYFIGEKLGLFGDKRTGTQIYIWNLDKWGNDYTLEWNSGKSSENPVHKGCGDILIRSRRVRSRPGQTSNKVPLDYSLQSYLEVMFLNPRMKIFVQGSLSYKRVGGQKHSADVGRGVIGVADITNLIDDGDGNSWVLNSKQGFQDCELYAKLEEWLDRKVAEYWDAKFDNLELRKGDEHYKPDADWVQCYSCRKWRVLNAGFNIDTLPEEWFCYMPPFNDDLDGVTSQAEDEPRPLLRRLRRGPSKTSKC
nr:unnamed protein product [Digitaria exilis]